MCCTSKAVEVIEQDKRSKYVNQKNNSITNNEKEIQKNLSNDINNSLLSLNAVNNSNNNNSNNNNLNTNNDNENSLNNNSSNSNVKSYENKSLQELKLKGENAVANKKYTDAINIYTAMIKYYPCEVEDI